MKKTIFTTLTISVLSLIAGCDGGYGYGSGYSHPIYSTDYGSDYHYPTPRNRGYSGYSSSYRPPEYYRMIAETVTKGLNPGYDSGYHYPSYGSILSPYNMQLDEIEWQTMMQNMELDSLRFEIDMMKLEIMGLEP